jgi:hypothetical protein
MTTRNFEQLRGLLRCCALAIIFLPNMVVLAQDQADAGDELEEIVVTGTRITTGNLGSAVPVMTVDSEYIQLSGETVLTNLLQQSPALIGSVSGEYSGSGGADTGAGGRDTDGTAALNLRNLGESRYSSMAGGMLQAGRARRSLTSTPYRRPWSSA